MSLDTEEKSKYEQIWKDKRYRNNSPGYRLRDQVLALLREKRCESASDFGVGSGKLAAFIQNNGIKVVGYDIADNCLDDDVKVDLRVKNIWEEIEPETDSVICTDVLEHIPPKFVDATIENLLKFETGIVQVHLKEDKFGEMVIGAPLHLTIEPAEWWVEKFNSKETQHEVKFPVVTIWW